MIYDGLWGTFSARVFTSIITSIFLFSVFVFVFIKKKRQWVISRVPTLLTALGLFGTFWGVAEGLGNFNAHDIDGSVIVLLDGMKLAFWTSILGMFYAFLINIIYYFLGLFVKEQATDGIDIEDILRTNLAIVDEIEGTHKTIIEGCSILNALLSSLRGDNNVSVFTQLYSLRQDTFKNNINVRKKLDDIHLSFNSFASKVAENNSKALIEALEEVMRDFNVKINEQFGENFKHLNQAVGALLSWQENYRTQIQELIDHFQTVRSGIAQIRENLGVIPNTMSQLQTTVMILDQGMKGTQALLKSFSVLQEQAERAFPTIQQSVADLTESFATSVERSTEAVERSVKNMEKSTEEQNSNKAFFVFSSTLPQMSAILFSRSMINLSIRMSSGVNEFREASNVFLVCINNSPF